MCGIAGQLAPSPSASADRSLAETMTRRLAHRGPDGEGIFVDGPCALGHRRLSIVDLEGGAQPMSEAATGFTLSFNGEIYNFPLLKERLEGLGHRFRTRCDTEVILKAWAQWGPAAVRQLKGMFAFALWDARIGRLFLVRDRLGKKPLYYASLPDGGFVFASELKSFAGLDGLKREIDSQALVDYFAYGYIPDPRSIYRGVHKLPPAHTLSLAPGEAPRLERYWDVPDDLDAPPAGGAGLEEEFLERFDNAVARRLLSDVPLGAFLSGGVDSSAVVASLAGQSAGSVKSFCIGFSDPEADESAYAQQVADRYGTDHSVDRIDPDAFDLIDRLAHIYDEPFGDNSALPTYQVCQAARQRVTVALSGDGGDEALAGYRRYAFHWREERLRRLLPSGVRKPLFGVAARLYPKLDWAPRFLRAKTTFAEMAMDEAEAIFQGVSVMDGPAAIGLLSPDVVQGLAGYDPVDPIREALGRCPYRDSLARVQYADLSTWLAGGILTKVDRASMAVSLEVRAPLLDTDLLAWCFALPP
ncbi:MAG: asparagine synthase (glutamine-hydrolyzing), partial [Pseudomonadota bacterium]